MLCTQPFRQNTLHPALPARRFAPSSSDQTLCTQPFRPDALHMKSHHIYYNNKEITAKHFRWSAELFWLRVTCRPECLYCPAAFLTSVPEACFQCFVRKFHALYPCGLPYPRPVFCFLDGSFVLCTLADFRTRTPFSPFWTEVDLRNYCLLLPHFLVFLCIFKNISK